MRKIIIESDNITSPLGSTAAENFSSLKNSLSGISLHHDKSISNSPFWGAQISKQELYKAFPHIKGTENFTGFEKLIVASVSDALKKSPLDWTNSKTIFIISATKGNIDMIEGAACGQELYEKVALHESAKKIATCFNYHGQPVLVSNACISGVLAIIIAGRLLVSGQYDCAVVAGADVMSRFIWSGFDSFQALGKGRCMPFDKSRDGLSLGEAAGTMILRAREEKSHGKDSIYVSGGATSNDANHISGPSRTGEELCLAINKAIEQSEIRVRQIDFISAHGTATPFNDEMEAKAFHLAGLEKTPVNSLKGFF